MDPVIETAPSGRARCRGCGQPIDKGGLRLGERLPNPFSDAGPMTLWFHLLCGAYKRPEVMLAALAASTQPVEDRQWLREQAERGVAHRRLCRVNGAERAPSPRARCRSCREAIAGGSWRIALVYYEEGRFEPSGFVHAACCSEYFGTAEILDRALHFAPDLTAGDVEELRAALRPE
jgi:hypothetical protein